MALRLLIIAAPTTLSEVPGGWAIVCEVDGVRFTPLVGAPIGP